MTTILLKAPEAICSPCKEAFGCVADGAVDLEVAIEGKGVSCAFEFGASCMTEPDDLLGFGGTNQAVVVLGKARTVMKL